MDDPTPEQLFAENAAWARGVSARLAGRHRLPPDDAEADGLVGLWHASRRYRPSRGAPFRAYARHRVRGAVLDGARNLPGRTRRPGHRLLSLDCPAVPDGGPDDRAAVDAAEEVACLLRPLTDRERAFVRGHFLEGRAVADIAAEWGCHYTLVSRVITDALRAAARAAPEKCPD